MKIRFNRNDKIEDTAYINEDIQDLYDMVDEGGEGGDTSALQEQVDALDEQINGDPDEGTAGLAGDVEDLIIQINGDGDEVNGLAGDVEGLDLQINGNGDDVNGLVNDVDGIADRTDSLEADAIDINLFDNGEKTISKALLYVMYKYLGGNSLPNDAEAVRVLTGEQTADVLSVLEAQILAISGDTSNQ